MLLQYTAPLRCLEKSIRSMGVGTEGAGGPSPPIIQLGGRGAPLPNNGIPRSEKKKSEKQLERSLNYDVAVTFGQNKQFWIKNVCLGNLCLCLVAHSVGS